jgi:hypothetical protein
MQGPASTPLPPGFDLNLLIERLIPLVGVLAVLIVGAIALRWLFRSPIAEAISEGIRQRRRRRYGADVGETGEQRVAELERELQAVQGQLTELGERLDFTERLLAQSREPERLRPPRG